MYDDFWNGQGQNLRMGDVGKGRMCVCVWGGGGGLFGGTYPYWP